MPSIFDPTEEEVARYLAEARELARAIYANEEDLAVEFMENAHPETLGTKDFDERSMSPEDLIRQEGMRGYVVVERALIGVAKKVCADIFNTATELLGDEEKAELYLFASNKHFDRKKPIVVAAQSQEGAEKVKSAIERIAYGIAA